MKSRMTICICLGLLMTACTSTQGPPQTRILGSWQSSVAGYPVVVSYATDTVTVDGAPPIGYSLDGNELTFDNGGSMRRLVSFPSRHEMIQTDPVTGTEQRFSRLESD